MITALNPQISLDILIRLISKSWESDVCRIADCHNNIDDSRLDDDRRHVPQEVPALQESVQHRQLRPFHELKDMVHDGQVFSMEQCTNLYFDHTEVINNLVESFQMYYKHILNNPLSAPKYRTKQSEQASYYKKIIRNIDVVLQMDQVHCVCEGLRQVPSSRYVPTQEELENGNIKIILCTGQGDADIADKKKQIIHKEFIMEKGSRINHQESESRLRNIDDLTDMGFSLTRFSPIPTIGDTTPQTLVGSGTTTLVPTSTP